MVIIAMTFRIRFTTKEGDGWSVDASSHCFKCFLLFTFQYVMMNRTKIKKNIRFTWKLLQNKITN